MGRKIEKNSRMNVASFKLKKFNVTAIQLTCNTKGSQLSSSVSIILPGVMLPLIKTAFNSHKNIHKLFQQADIQLLSIYYTFSWLFCS